MTSRSSWLFALPLALVVGWAGLSRGGTTQFEDNSLDLVDQLSDAFEQVAEDIESSVVRIQSVRRIEPPPRGGRNSTPFPFQEFFGPEFFERFHVPQEPYIQEGLGSGFVLTADGYVVTNDHLVRDGAEIDVHFTDGRTLRGQLVGSDSKTDIAILKVEAKDLKPVRLGNSAELRPGQWVIAAGTPFGLTSTITTGVVSAIDRADVGISEYENFIQTDAAINPGNSGGPLLNLHGEVVGVNSAIYTRSGGYMGIGFAIPINILKSVQDDLMQYGAVTRGMLGVTIQDLDKGLAESFDFEGTAGVLVSDVYEGGPADKAGLEAGDIIVSFHGEDMANKDQLRFRVAETSPGSEVPIEVFRDGKLHRFTVTVEQASPADDATTPPQQKELDLGIEVDNLSPEIATRLGLPGETLGVVITNVVPASPAARAGLRPGDVVSQIGVHSVNSVDQFREILGKQDLSVGVRMSIKNNRGQRFAFLQVL